MHARTHAQPPPPSSDLSSAHTNVAVSLLTAPATNDLFTGSAGAVEAPPSARGRPRAKATVATVKEAPVEPPTELPGQPNTPQPPFAKAESPQGFTVPPQLQPLPFGALFVPAPWLPCPPVPGGFLLQPPPGMAMPPWIPRQPPLVADGAPSLPLLLSPQSQPSPLGLSPVAGREEKAKGGMCEGAEAAVRELQHAEAGVGRAGRETCSGPGDPSGVGTGGGSSEGSGRSSTDVQGCLGTPEGPAALNPCPATPQSANLDKPALLGVWARSYCLLPLSSSSSLSMLPLFLFPTPFLPVGCSPPPPWSVFGIPRVLNCMLSCK